MREGPIKHLPVVKHYVEYFTRKAKVALGLKRLNYKSVSIDYSSRGTVYVYFHGKDKCVASISFYANGEQIGCVNNTPTL